MPCDAYPTSPATIVAMLFCESGPEVRGRNSTEICTAHLFRGGSLAT